MRSLILLSLAAAVAAATVRDVLVDAINVGAPLYNRGGNGPIACYYVYMRASEEVVLRLDPKYQSSRDIKATFADALPRARRAATAGVSGAADAAWILRRAFDFIGTAIARGDTADLELGDVPPASSFTNEPGLQELYAAFGGDRRRAQLAASAVERGVAARYRQLCDDEQFVALAQLAAHGADLAAACCAHAAAESASALRRVMAVSSDAVAVVGSALRQLLMRLVRPTDTTLYRQVWNAEA